MNAKIPGNMRSACSRIRHQKGKFLMQPHNTTTPYFPDNLQEYAPWVAKHGLIAPYGECQCGCKAQTNLLKANDKTKGHIKGQPRRYCNGHCVEKPAHKSLED